MESFPQSNGTCEGVIREVVCTLKAMPKEGRMNARNRVGLIPADQSTLNTAYRKMCCMRLLSIMSCSGELGIRVFVPWLRLQAMSGSLYVLDKNALKRPVQHIVASQIHLQKDVLTAT